MNAGIKKLMAYTPVAAFWIVDAWAFATGTYASERDKILPYLFAVLIFIYMLPAINAAHRDHSQFIWIWLIDIFGTPFFLIGWVVALIWAFIDPRRRQPSSTSAKP